MLAASIIATLATVPLTGMVAMGTAMNDAELEGAGMIAVAGIAVWLGWILD
jgi:hypothetical protein